ncbi:MAG: coiled-coil domain-containing protein [Bacteroidia bacterium]
MKPAFGKILIFCSFFFFSICAIAQEYSPEEHVKSAKELELKQQLWAAAERYASAALLYEQKAATLDDNKTSGPKKQRYFYILRAKEYFAKAAQLYRANYNLDKEDYAKQKVAYLDMKIALEGLEGLDYNDKEEKKKDEEKNKPVINKGKIPYEPGEIAYFAGKEAKLRITMPLAMNNKRFREQMQDTTQKNWQNKTNFFLFTTDIGRISMGLNEHLGDHKKENKGPGDKCDEEAESFKKGVAEMPAKGLADEAGIDINKIFKTASIGFGVKACVTMEQIKMPFQNDTTIRFQIAFNINNNFYVFSGSAPVNWKDAMMKMMATFQILDTGNYKNCTKGEFQELKDLTFHDYYRLPDPSRPVKITITPVIARNKVPEAWHNYIAVVRKGMEKIASMEEDNTPEEVKNIIMVLNKLKFEEITPGKVADAYLDVMDKMITGVQGLEMKITNMSLDYKCEIPYLLVHTTCTPHVVCKDNKYVPDYTIMTYKQIDKSNGVEIIDRKFLTLMGIKQLEETLLKKALTAMEYDVKLYNEEDKCARHTSDLRIMDFGVMPDVCQKRKANWAHLTKEMEDAKTDSIRYQKELKDFRTTKAAKIATLNQQVEGLNKRLNLTIEEIKKANATLNQYKNSGTYNSATDAQILKQTELITKLNSDLEHIKESRLEHTNSADYLNRKAEPEIQSKITAMAGRMTELRRLMTKAKPELDKCK